jgi:amidohydrolase
MKDKIQSLAKAYHAEIIAHRRYLHSHPELSFNEVNTANYVCEQLDKLNITYQKGVGGHGIVAHLGNGKEVVALRADMDALPILEKNDVAYKSKNEGIMHACGHDVHTASLLGAAMILKQIEAELDYKVRLIFQPAEEKLPGGASLMIKEGVLKNPIPINILGQHVHPPLEVGKVGLKAGMYMASADEIYIEVQGRGGHGALPQECKDPIITAANILVALQQIVSRHAPPTVPTVLTFGKINSDGGATNVIPYKVYIEGTFRTMNEEWREKALSLITQIAEGTAESHGLKAVVTIPKGYPYLQNDEILTPLVKSKMQEYLGEENVVDLPIRMTAEDFSYYTHHVPACFYRLGTGNIAKGITSPVHTDTFNIDEDALLVGAGLMAWLAYSGVEV